MRNKIANHILELLTKNKLNQKDFAGIINKDIRTAQNRFKNRNWTFEEIESIERHFNERILYSAKEFVANEEVKAVIQIELKNKQKEAVLKQLIGKKDLEILNK